MSIEAMKQALEALEEINRTGDTQLFDLCYAPKVIPALRQAIAEAEKPWVKTYAGGKPNYTTRQESRQVAKNATTGNQQVAKSATTEWVGLRDEDLPEGETYDFDRGVRWAETKLRSKNT